MTSAAKIYGGEVMTDFQFKALIEMVLDLLESNEDPDKVKVMLRKLIGKDDEE